MNITWELDHGPEEPDHALQFDGVEMAFVRRRGDWWTVRFMGLADDKYPDGMRFERDRLRAAKNYAVRHAHVLWIGRNAPPENF